MNPPPLPRGGGAWRGGRLALGLLPALLAAAGLLWPNFMRGMDLFHLWTGLPCPFCGGTRALRAFLRGDLAAVWYYNPLVVALVAGGLGWMAWWWGEALRGRPWPLVWNPHQSRMIGRMLLLGLGLFWVVHILMACLVPKPELLDAGGWVWQWWAFPVGNAD